MQPPGASPKLNRLPLEDEDRDWFMVAAAHAVVAKAPPLPPVHPMYVKCWTLPSIVNFRTRQIKVYESHEKSINAALSEGAGLKILFSTYHALLNALRRNINYMNSQTVINDVLDNLKKIYLDYNAWQAKVPGLLDRNLGVIERIKEITPLQVEDRLLPQTQSTTVSAMAGLRAFVQEEQEHYASQSAKMALAEKSLKALEEFLKNEKTEITDLETELSILKGNPEAISEEERRAAAAGQSQIQSLLTQFIAQLQNWFLAKKDDNVIVAPISKSPKPALRVVQVQPLSRSGSSLSRSWLGGWFSSSDDRANKAPPGNTLKQQFTNVPKREQKKAFKEEEKIPRESLFTHERWNATLLPLEENRNSEVPTSEELTQEQIWKIFFKENHQEIYKLIGETLNCLHGPCLELQAEYQRLFALKSQASQNPLLKQLFNLSLRIFNDKVDKLKQVYAEVASKISTMHSKLLSVTSALAPQDQRSLEFDQMLNALEQIDAFLNSFVKADDKIILDIKDALIKEKKMFLQIAQWVFQLDKDLIEQAHHDTQAELAMRRAQEMITKIPIPKQGEQVKPPPELTEAYEACALHRNLAQLPNNLFPQYLTLRKALQPLHIGFETSENFAATWSEYLRQMTSEEQLPAFQKAMVERENNNREVLEKCFKQQAVQLQKAQKEFDSLFSAMRNLHWDAEKVKAWHKPEDDRLGIYLEQLLVRFEAIKEQGEEMQLYYKSVLDWLEAFINVYKKKLGQKPWYDSHTPWSLRTQDGIAALRNTCEQVVAYFELSKMQLEYTYNNQILVVGDELVSTLNALVDLRDKTGGLTNSMLSMLSLSQLNGSYVSNPFKVPPKPVEAVPPVAVPAPAVKGKELPLVIQDA